MFIFPSPTAWWPVGPNQLAWIKLKKLDGCIVWNAHNAVFGSKRSAFCAQAVYFLHSTRPSVTWRNRRWRLAACDWVMSALPAVLSTRVRRRRKFWEVSCVEFTFQRNDFELIPTVEIGTKNPADGYFSSEFPSICNHCGDTAAWSRKTLKCLKSVKSCVAYLTKKNYILSGSPAVATVRIAPKICQGQPPTMYLECSRFHPNRFTFVGVIAERVNTAKTHCKARSTPATMS